MTFDCAYLLHRVYRNVENIEFVEIYRKGTKFIIEKSYETCPDSNERICFRLKQTLISLAKQEF